MTFDDKTQPNPGKDQKAQGGSDRTHPIQPGGPTSGQGQTDAKAGIKADDQELDEQGRATGQMSNQKESNRFAGTSSKGNPPGSGATGGANR